MRNSNPQKPETFLVYVREVSFFIFIPPVRTRGMFSKKQRIIWKYEIKFVLTNNCRLMENKSHLSRDKRLLFCDTRLLFCNTRHSCRDTQIAEDALDFEREARPHARRYEGNKSGPAPCGHRKQPVICKNFPCFYMLLYRYKGTKKSRKNRMFSMKNVTISDIYYSKKRDLCGSLFDL